MNNKRKKEPCINRKRLYLDSKNSNFLLLNENPDNVINQNLKIKQKNAKPTKKSRITRVSFNHPIINRMIDNKESLYFIYGVITIVLFPYNINFTNFNNLIVSYFQH